MPSKRAAPSSRRRLDDAVGSDEPRPNGEAQPKEERRDDQVSPLPLPHTPNGPTKDLEGAQRQPSEDKRAVDLNPMPPRSLRGMASSPKTPPRTTATPRPAKRKKSFWPRKLKFTREGKYFLGITLGVGFAAINTGNNLLYLMLGMMLSLIIISGVMSELSLRRLTVRRRLPNRAQVGRSHLVEIEVYNSKKQVPSYAIEVEDLRAGQPADKRCFFLKISPQSTQIAAYRRTPLRRGLEQHTGFRIATRFPFGLFEKSREVDSSDELIIYPAVDPVRLPQRGHGESAGDAGPLGRGAGEEIYALRHMREGDDPRDIYWRKSTTPGFLVLRERAREMRHEVEFLIEVARPPGEDNPGDDKNQGAVGPTASPFERRVREVASYAVAHVKRGDRVMIITTAGERVLTDRARGIDPVLRFLALVQQVEPSDQARPLDPIGWTDRPGRSAVESGSGEAA